MKPSQESREAESHLPAHTWGSGPAILCPAPARAGSPSLSSLNADYSLLNSD